MWFLPPPIALVQCPHELVPPGHERERFFYRFSSHHISLLLACGFAFCYPATRISISPRSSPRYHRHDMWGGSWLRYEWRASGYPACLVRTAMDGYWDGVGDVMCLLDFTRAMPSIS